jgi:hypothetical protein
MLHPGLFGNTASVEAYDALLGVLERDHHAIEKMLSALVVEDAKIDQSLARVAGLGHRVKKRSVAECAFRNRT